jgi:hypothetical protein
MKTWLTLITTALLAGTVTAQTDFQPDLAADVLLQQSPALLTPPIKDDEALQQAYMATALEDKLAQQAAALGLDETIQFHNSLQQARRRILVALLRNTLAQQVQPPQPAEILTAYTNQLARWTEPEGYQVDVLEYDPDNEQTATQVEQLCTEKSVEDDRLNTLEGRWIVTKSAERWLTQDDFSPAIWQALPDMTDGQAQSFENGATRLFIRRVAYRPANRRSLQAVEPLIKNELTRQQEQVNWNRHLRKMREGLGL